MRKAVDWRRGGQKRPRTKKLCETNQIEEKIHARTAHTKLYEHSTFIVSNPYLHHHNNNHNIEIKGKHMFCYAIRIESDNFLV